jgi:hypothetical protein
MLLNASESLFLSEQREDGYNRFFLGTLFYTFAKGSNAEAGTKSAKAVQRKCF